MSSISTSVSIEAPAGGGSGAGFGEEGVAVGVGPTVSPSAVIPISDGCRKRIEAFDLAEGFSKKKAILGSSKFFKNIKSISDFEFVFKKIKTSTEEHFKSSEDYKGLMHSRGYDAAATAKASLDQFVFGELFDLFNKFIDFESSRLFKSKKTVADRILNAQELVRLFSLISSIKKEIRGEDVNLMSSYQVNLIALVDLIAYDLWNKKDVLSKISRSYVFNQAHPENQTELLNFLKAIAELGVTADFLKLLVPDLDSLLGVVSALRESAKPRADFPLTSPLLEIFVLEQASSALQLSEVISALRDANLSFICRDLLAAFKKHFISDLAGLIQVLGILQREKLRDEVSSLLDLSGEMLTRDIKTMDSLISFIRSLVEAGLKASENIMPLTDKLLSGLLIYRPWVAYPPSFEKWVELLSVFNPGTLESRFLERIAPPVKKLLKADSGEGDVNSIKKWIVALVAKIREENLTPALVLFLGPISGPIKSGAAGLHPEYVKAVLLSFKQMLLVDSHLRNFLAQALKLERIQDYLALKTCLSEVLIEEFPTDSSREALLKPALVKFISEGTAASKVSSFDELIFSIQTLKSLDSWAKIGNFLEHPGVLQKIQTLDHLEQILRVLMPIAGVAISPVIQAQRHKVLSYFLRERVPSQIEGRSVASVVEMIDRLKLVGCVSDFQLFLDDPKDDETNLLKTRLGVSGLGDLDRIRLALDGTGLKPKGPYFLTLFKTQVQVLITGFLLDANPKTTSTQQIIKILNKFDELSLIGKRGVIEDIRKALKDSDDRDFKYQNSKLYRMFHWWKRSPQAEALYAKIREICNFCDGVEVDGFRPERGIAPPEPRVAQVFFGNGHGAAAGVVGAGVEMAARLKPAHVPMGMGVGALGGIQ
jgi:hypothetical protein